jgi:arsenite-transporting ATPase
VNERIYLLGGTGGVGKTTCSAALGIYLASLGKKTMVLTVDPARRLAQVLGLDSFHNEIQTVPEVPGLSLSMLDSRRYFDKIVEKFATSEKQKERLFNNALYRTMVENLGGTQEYAAMERILEFAHSTEYDCIVVDTPPSQNAVDLLSAPKRLAEFMDNSVLRWFQGKQPGFLSWFRQGTKIVMKVLQAIFGSDFLSRFSDFLDAMDGMQAGFQSRHIEVLELLKSKDTGFWMVATATEARYRESLSFYKTLSQEGIHVSGLILNQLESPFSSEEQNLSEAGCQKWLAFEKETLARQKDWESRFEDSFSPVKKLYRLQGNYDLSALKNLGKTIYNT